MMKFITLVLLAFSLNAYTQLPAVQLNGSTSLFSPQGSMLANPTAQPDITCSGQTVQLFALSGRGTNAYTYSWTSDPQGFTSLEPNPMVNPLITTDYRVDIFDGISTSTGHVTVIVKPLPSINLLPINDPEVFVISPHEIGTCVFHPFDLDAGNPGAFYQWNDGSTTRSIHVETSGISADLQEYEVVVTDPATGCSNTAAITVYFTFSDCTYGVEESESTPEVNLYPNPSPDGVFICDLHQFMGDVKLEIFSTQGMMIKNQVIAKANKNLSSTIDLSDQVTGVYILRASNKEDVLFKKLIIR